MSVARTVLRWKGALLAVALALQLAVPVAGAADAPMPAASAPQDLVLVAGGATWAYHDGMTDAPHDWKDRAFDDTAWRRGPSGIGFGDDDDATVLDDMQGRYLTLYMRHAFEVATPAELKDLVLSMVYDDGFVAYLNGTEVARRGVAGDPPSRNARAVEHEAGAAEAIPLPDALRLLVQGKNVLAVEVHDASLGSSDLSALPVLLAQAAQPDVTWSARPTDAAAREESVAPEPPRLARTSGRALTSRTTFAWYHTDNYFQAVDTEGAFLSPKTEVLGAIVREELRFRPTRSPDLRLSVRMDFERVGALGTSPMLSLRVELDRHAHRWRFDIDSRWNRPSFIDPAGRLATEDSTSLSITHSFRGPHGVEWSGWLLGLRQVNTLDARREADELTLGASARFRREHRELSPEVGFELGRRETRDAALAYEQLRLFLEIHSAPTPRTWLAGFFRWTTRDYTTDDEILANFERNDRRRVGRVSAGFQATPLVGISGSISREDGSSSRPNRPGVNGDFDTSILWAGVTLSY